MLNTIENVEFVKNFLIKSRDSDINVLENIDHFFKPKRVFYISSSKKNEIRGGHAHKTLEQFIWAINGILEVKAISQNMKKFNYLLKSPYEGLYLPPMIWSNQFSRSKNSIYCVAASDYYAEKDYIRDWEKFSKSLIS